MKIDKDRKGDFIISVVIVVITIIFFSFAFKPMIDYTTKEKPHKFFVQYKDQKSFISHNTGYPKRIFRNSLYLIDNEGNEVDMKVSVREYRSTKEKTYVTYNMTQREIKTIGEIEMCLGVSIFLGMFGLIASICVFDILYNYTKL